MLRANTTYRRPSSLRGSESRFSNANEETACVRFPPVTAQSARFLWCSVSNAFDPSNLSEGNGGMNCVSKAELSAHGFDIVYVGYFSKEQEFKDRKTGERHPTLMAVRAWFDSTIYGRTIRTFPPRRLETPNTWVAFARNTTDVDQVIASHMSRPPAPMR